MNTLFASMDSTKYELEKMIDYHGLPNVIQYIVQICYEKSAHCLENWQDKTLGKQWDRDAVILNEAHSKLYS